MKAPPKPKPIGGPQHAPSFGELDLDAIFNDGNGEGANLAAKPAVYERPKPFSPKDGPPSSRRISVREMPTHQSLAAVSKLAQEETRIAQAGVLASAVAESRRPAPLEDAATRIGSFNAAVEGLLEDSRASSPSSRRNAPSASGVASRDDRVAAMRELYAQGNADEALALASTVATDFDEEAAEDGYGGLEPVDDPYGGLEPVDDAEPTALFSSSSSASAPLAQLTSSRQIPRLLIQLKDLSKLPMDPRAAFLLSHMDGIQSMEEILDVCAMPEADALELVEWLQTLGVITVE